MFLNILNPFNFSLILLFFKFIYLFIYIYFWLFWVFVSVRGISLVAASRGHFIAVRGPLTVAASLVAEHRLQTRRLSSCGSRVQLLRGMWDLPRPGLEPVSLHWQADSQPLRHQGSPFTYSLVNFGNVYFSRKINVSLTFFKCLFIAL